MAATSGAAEESSSKRRRLRSASTLKCHWMRTRWQHLQGEDEENGNRADQKARASQEYDSGNDTGTQTDLVHCLNDDQFAMLAVKTAEATANRLVASLQSQADENVELTQQLASTMEALTDLERTVEDMAAQKKSLQQQLEDSWVAKQAVEAKLSALHRVPKMRPPLQPQPPQQPVGKKYVRESGNDDKVYRELTGAGFLDLERLALDSRNGVCSYKTALRLIARRLRDPDVSPGAIEELEVAKEELQEFLPRR